MLSRSLLILLAFTATAPFSRAQDPADTGVAETTLTIYAAADGRESPGRALVQQRRRLDLPQGESRIDLTDIPATLDPATVFFHASDDASFSILEQTFRTTDPDPDSLLRHCIGRDILVNRRAAGDRVTETISARLLGFDEKVLVLQTNNRQLPIQIIARGPDISEIKLMNAKDMPATRPTLSWLVTAESAGPRDVQLIYEARGMTWNADYTLLLDPDGAAASLDAWTTITNRTGTPFTDAQVRLTHENDQRSFPFGQYLLPRTVTLASDVPYRFALLSGRRVKVSRIHVFEPLAADDVADCLSISNARENQLGESLPPGQMRILRRGHEGPATLIAQTTLRAAAPQSAMLVRVGRAESLAATRRITESRQGAAAKQTTTITITNRRPEKARVLVIERLEHETARITENSHPFEKRDGAGRVIGFTLEIPPGESQTLSFTADAA